MSDNHRQVSRASAGRVLARQVTTAVRERNAFASSVLATYLANSTAPAEEKSFATLLVYGVVASQGVLDEIIDRNLRTSGDIQPDVRDALRVSAYEMAFLHKSDYACVDQGVELVRSVTPRAAGLANAVLRKMARDLTSFPWGDVQRDVAALARSHAYPTWLAQRFVDTYGWSTATDMLAATDAPAPVFIGANPYRCDDKELLSLLRNVDPTAQPFGASGCFLTSASAAVVRSEALHSGRALVSDAAAQQVAALATPRAGEPFLEVGSGRGTKTILLQGDALRRHGAPARLFALDIHDFKGNVLTKRLDDFSIPCVVPLVGDATKLDEVLGLPQSFAGALIDAPCSGLGTLRRHPEQRWRVRPEVIGQIAALGSRMLESVASHIATGGFIVYSTCTVTPEENDVVIKRFLASKAGADFEVESLRGQLAPEFADYVTPDGFFQSLPHSHGADGHFAAKLVRTTRKS